MRPLFLPGVFTAALHRVVTTRPMSMSSPSVVRHDLHAFLGGGPLPRGREEEEESALVVLNSASFGPWLLERLWAASSFRVCADGGANRLFDLLGESHVPDAIVGDLDSARAAVLAAYGAAGAGPLAATSQEALCFDEADTCYFFQTMLFPFANYSSYEAHVERFRKNDLPDAFTIHCCATKPESRGAVTLGSNDATKPPVVRHGYLSDPRDLAALVAALKAARRVAASPALAAHCAGELLPGPGCASDADLEAYVRASFCHFAGCLVGTCKMGAHDDPDAVVDAGLRVRGVRNLRVVDASVFPTTLNGQPNAAVSAIAHKVAGAILDDARAAAV